MSRRDPFNAFSTLDVAGETYKVARLQALEDAGITRLDKLPVSVRVLLESVLRNVDGETITEQDVKNAASWKPDVPQVEIPFMPGRVVLQDFTGVPCAVDLAALRSAAAAAGKNPGIIEPLVPCDLVIDHSVQVDFAGTLEAFGRNVNLEYERNTERYQFLKWAQKAFKKFRVVPPGTGIVHQVNLEYLADAVWADEATDGRWAYPDTLVGTDSHTTMIGGIGVVGWGVGGIEAEAVMLGQPYFMPLPDVIGVRLEGELPRGATATDLVLHITETLRKVGVVDKFVEFFGPGIANLTVADRATIANMAPEQGSTISFFPVDDATLEYLRLSGRTERVVQRVEAYNKLQGLFGAQEAEFTKIVEIDIGTVEPSLAGPKRPQDRVAMTNMKTAFATVVGDKPNAQVPVTLENGASTIEHGSAVIAAITSCTNTSNPSVMVAAGLVAKRATEKGLTVPPHVKASLAPGSRVVTEYLDAAGLTPYLDQLRFNVVGYGCTTCIGNAGPLDKPIEDAVVENDLVVAAVLSGNRNFEARIHANVRANYLASPPLVVAYALAGRVDINLETEPLGKDKDGNDVFLRDLWPTPEDVRDTVTSSLTPDMFREKYATVFDGDERWQALPVPEAEAYEWSDESTYVREPPFFQDFPLDDPTPQDVTGARVLAKLGLSVTTDHISPAGAITKASPAGKWLMEQGVEPVQFNTYGARRGNHEVMMRGTFANVRIKNLLAPGTEGGVTIYHPTGEQMSIFDAAMKYRDDGTPLVVLAGAEYGTGSSRDWAAKGTYLLGVKAVIAESFERIHRSNLTGMGVLPLEFKPGQSADSLGLDGTETIDIVGLADLTPRATLQATATKTDGTKVAFEVVSRLDTPAAVRYYKNGGILQTVLRRMLKAA